MKLMTISEVTKRFQISTRMLRYYEQIGLLSSTRMDDYAYRAYDEASIRRLQQIITLRKLHIPLKKISALQTIRDILQLFLLRLSQAADMPIKSELLADEEIMDVIKTLRLSKIKFKENILWKN